jgi:hypothetical protein
MLLFCACACQNQAKTAEEAKALMDSASICQLKGDAILSSPGSCEDKHRQLETLLITDRDCIATFADAGAPTLKPCPKPRDGGAP